MTLRHWIPTTAQIPPLNYVAQILDSSPHCYTLDTYTLSTPCLLAKWMLAGTEWMAITCWWVRSGLKVVYLTSFLGLLVDCCTWIWRLGSGRGCTAEKWLSGWVAELLTRRTAEHEPLCPEVPVCKNVVAAKLPPCDKVAPCCCDPKVCINGCFDNTTKVVSHLSWSWEFRDGWPDSSPYHQPSSLVWVWTIPGSFSICVVCLGSGIACTCH